MIIGLLAITVTSCAVILFVSFLDDDKSIVSAQVVDVDEPPTNATEELDVLPYALKSLIKLLNSFRQR